MRRLALVAAIIGTTGCSSRHGTVAAPGAPPEALRSTVAALPENPCELLTAEQVSAATNLRITRAYRVPDIGEIIRAEREGRTARANTICSYDTPSEFRSVSIIVPPVSEQSSAAYRTAREDYSRQFHADRIPGLGQDAWLAGGTMLHVLAGNSSQFMVAMRTVQDGSRDALIAVAKAVLARLYK